YRAASVYSSAESPGKVPPGEANSLNTPYFEEGHEPTPVALYAPAGLVGARRDTRARGRRIDRRPQDGRLARQGQDPRDRPQGHRRRRETRLADRLAGL